MKQKKLFSPLLIYVLSTSTQPTWAACARFCNALKDATLTQTHIPESETKVRSSVAQQTELYNGSTTIQVPQKLCTAYVWFHERCVIKKKLKYRSHHVIEFTFTTPAYVKRVLELERCTTFMKYDRNGEYAAYSKLVYTHGRIKFVTLGEAQKLILNIETVKEWGAYGAVPFFDHETATTPPRIIITEPIYGNTITLEPHDGVLKATRVFHISSTVDRPTNTPSTDTFAPFKLSTFVQSIES